jgi:hypothetical protein
MAVSSIAAADCAAIAHCYCLPQGATLSSVEGELVLYGGDKSGVSVCTPGIGEWRWSSVTPSGTAPADRQLHSAVVVDGQAVVFGGASLADGSELADAFWLKKMQNGNWAWGCPKSHTPYVR